MRSGGTHRKNSVRDAGTHRLGREEVNKKHKQMEENREYIKVLQRKFAKVLAEVVPPHRSLSLCWSKGKRGAKGNRGPQN